LLQAVVEQYLNIEGLSLKEKVLKVKQALLQAVVEQYLNLGGLSLKEDCLKVRAIIASGCGRIVSEHRGPPPQGGRGLKVRTIIALASG
jgi:hypothetical protein